MSSNDLDKARAELSKLEYQAKNDRIAAIERFLCIERDPSVSDEYGVGAKVSRTIEALHDRIAKLEAQDNLTITLPTYLGGLKSWDVEVSKEEEDGIAPTSISDIVREVRANEAAKPKAGMTVREEDMEPLSPEQLEGLDIPDGYEACPVYEIGSTKPTDVMIRHKARQYGRVEDGKYVDPYWADDAALEMIDDLKASLRHLRDKNETYKEELNRSTLTMADLMKADSDLKAEALRVLEENKMLSEVNYALEWEVDDLKRQLAAKNVLPTITQPILPDYVSDWSHEWTDDVGGGNLRIRCWFKLAGIDMNYGFGGSDLAKLLSHKIGWQKFWDQWFAAVYAKVQKDGGAS